MSGAYTVKNIVCNKEYMIYEGTYFRPFSVKW